MRFNKHSPNLQGTHAFLSPSKNSWVNYDESQLEARYSSVTAAARGTRFHALACELITLGVKLPDNTKTMNRYVNDAIGFKMTPEQMLVYSANCFGTADAISYRQNTLRIHDLKTGRSKTNFVQHLIYAALFFLEYGDIAKPYETHVVLRIYQSNDFFEYIVEDPGEIVELMSKIQRFDAAIERMRMEADS